MAHFTIRQARESDNEALVEIVPALLIPYDPDDQAFAAIKQFERFEFGIQLFSRPIRREVKLGDRPLYLDPTDL